MASRTNPARPPTTGGPQVAQNGNGPAIVARLLSEANAVHDLPVTIYGTTLTFHYRRIGWTERGDIAADSWTDEPSTLPNGQPGPPRRRYSPARFVQLCFERMFMTPDLARTQPFPLTPQVIKSFPPEVGRQFESILPIDDVTEDLQTVDDQKKASSESSEET